VELRWFDRGGGVSRGAVRGGLGARPTGARGGWMGPGHEVAPASACDDLLAGRPRRLCLPRCPPLQIRARGPSSRPCLCAAYPGGSLRLDRIRASAFGRHRVGREPVAPLRTAGAHEGPRDGRAHEFAKGSNGGVGAPAVYRPGRHRRPTRVRPRGPGHPADPKSLSVVHPNPCEHPPWSSTWNTHPRLLPEFHVDLSSDTRESTTAPHPRAQAPSPPPDPDPPPQGARQSPHPAGPNAAPPPTTDPARIPPERLPHPPAPRHPVQSTCPARADPESHDSPLAQSCAAPTPRSSPASLAAPRRSPEHRGMPRPPNPGSQLHFRHRASARRPAPPTRTPTRPLADSRGYACLAQHRPSAPSSSSIARKTATGRAIPLFCPSLRPRAEAPSRLRAPASRCLAPGDLATLHADRLDCPA
jgi:hypothetical protein